MTRATPLGLRPGQFYITRRVIRTEAQDVRVMKRFHFPFWMARMRRHKSRRGNRVVRFFDGHFHGNLSWPQRP